MRYWQRTPNDRKHGAKAATTLAAQTLEDSHNNVLTLSMAAPSKYRYISQGLLNWYIHIIFSILYSRMFTIRRRDAPKREPITEGRWVGEI